MPCPKLLKKERSATICEAQQFEAVSAVHWQGSEVCMHAQTGCLRNDLIYCVQDITMVHQSPYQADDQGNGYNLVVLGVADGHNGCAAALHCQEKLYSELMQRMPAGPPPSSPDSQGTAL